jgi:serine protease Do
MNRWIAALLTLFSSLPVLAQDPARVVQPVEQPEPPTINLRRTVTVDVVRKTKDAVVYISTTKLVTRRMSLFPDYPFDLGISQPVKVPATALGSGFIVHPDGYVVTNNHVVDRGRQIKVELGDGRKLDADLISADPTADLAILKVQTDKPLPYLTLGDSADLMIGEPVIAVGNPLGFSHSVSTGIVSAIHRDIQITPKSQLTDVIQTDAAINPGNSGGPLLNAYGQVIGINTAIRGDAQNIGFAIQVNKLRDMIPALLNPAQAAKLDIAIKLAEKRSVKEPSTVTSDVELVEEDDKRLVIAEINGRRPRDIIDAYALVLAAKPGESIAIKFSDGASRKVEVKAAGVPQAVTAIRKRIGLTVEELTPMLAQKRNIPDDDGILITEVDDSSIANAAGLKAGDVITQVHVYPVAKLDKFAILVSKLPKAGKIQIVVHRGEQAGIVELDMSVVHRNST